MEAILQGKAWLFGSNVSTDDILPGRVLDRSNEEVGPYAMSGIDEGFAGRIARGDFIVAGSNFGCGSSRESAPIAIKGSGIAAVVAESFARIFFRNAVNVGLPAAIVGSAAGIQQGHELRLDLANRRLYDLTTGESQPILNLTGISWEILQAGGIVEYTLNRMAGGSS